jgi:hypothetical protein
VAEKFPGAMLVFLLAQIVHSSISGAIFKLSESKANL